MTSINGKQPILNKVVIEVRYRYGYSYLDRCGRVLNTILRDHPEWIVTGNASPQNGSAVSLRSGTVFSFSSESYSLSIEKTPGSEGLSEGELNIFSDQVGAIGPIVQEILTLKEFTRIGLRAWYLIPCPTKESSEKWIRELGYFSIPDNVYQEFGGRRDAVGISIIVAGEIRKYRITMNSVEKNAQIDIGDNVLSVAPHSLSKDQDKVLRQQLAQSGRKLREAPQYAALVDVDVFWDEPSTECDPKDFLESCAISKLPDRLRRAMILTQDKI